MIWTVFTGDTPLGMVNEHSFVEAQGAAQDFFAILEKPDGTFRIRTVRVRPGETQLRIAHRKGLLS